jgi:hypothetical protein
MTVARRDNSNESTRHERSEGALRGSRVVSWRLYEYHSSILPVSAASAAYRNRPWSSARSSAADQCRAGSSARMSARGSALCKANMARWTARDHARLGMRASVQCASRAPGAVGVPSGLESYVGHKKCAHPVGVYAPTVRLACVCVHMCALLCVRFARVRVRASDGATDGREGTGGRGRSARSGRGHGRRERGRSAGVGCKNARSSKAHTR